MDLRIKSEDDRGGVNPWGKSENDRKGETGRSMVEMLGVLAVVGVLSVGGIAGYTYAMDKHYANELLMGASERAVLVAAQLVAGKTPNLNEFANHTAPNGTFGEVKTDIEYGFGIAVSGVKDAVCENLLKATDGTNVYIANDDDNLTDVTCSGDNNEFLFVFDYGVSGGAGEETDPACADVTCPEGSTCSRGQCQCSNGLFVCGTKCCAEGTYCARDGSDNTKYTCAVPTGECTQNSDCKDAEGNVDISKYCKFSSGGCSGPTGGTCVDKGTLTPKTLNLPGGALTVYKGDKMSWWSAVNFCEAHDKKQLVTMSDLGISDPAGKNSCYYDSRKTTDTTVYCECSGDEGCTTTTTELHDKFGTYGNLWLADNSKSTSCAARHVNLGDGNVSASNRASSYYAFCQ